MDLKEISLFPFQRLLSLVAAAQPRTRSSTANARRTRTATPSRRCASAPSCCATAHLRAGPRRRPRPAAGAPDCCAHVRRPRGWRRRCSSPLQNAPPPRSGGGGSGGGEKARNGGSSNSAGAATMRRQDSTTPLPKILPTAVTASKQKEKWRGNPSHW